MDSARTAKKGRDQRKLATYLGAGTAHRFGRKGRITVSQAHWRIRLFVAGALLLLLCVWSVWREFF